MAESKIKAHTRRTQSGTTRVREGRRKNRKSLGRKIAVTGAGLGAAGLITAYGLKKRRDFKDSKLLVNLAKQKIRNPKHMDDPTKKFEFLFSPEARKGFLATSKRLKSANPFINKMGGKANKREEIKNLISDLDSINQGYMPPTRIPDLGPIDKIKVRWEMAQNKRKNKSK